MESRCPECDTLFEVSTEQLALADGLVRCGVCGIVFQARTPDQSELPAVSQSACDAGLPAEANEFAGHEVRPDSTVLLTELNPISEPGPVSEGGVESREVSARVSNEEAVEDIDAILAAPPAKDRLVSMAFGVGTLILLLLLAGQYTYFHRHALIQYPAVHAVLTDVCGVLGCELEPFRDPSEIEVVSRNVHTHPDVPNALLITATFVNRALSSQPYPIMKVAFTDLQGTVLAARHFQPSEYLAAVGDSERFMQPDEPVDIRLEVRDPGIEALAFEIDFL